MSAMRPTAVDDIELAITGSEPEPEDAGGSRGWHRHANLAVEVGSNRLGWMPSAAATNSPLGSPFRPVPTTVQGCGKVCCGKVFCGKVCCGKVCCGKIFCGKVFCGKGFCGKVCCGKGCCGKGCGG